MLDENSLPPFPEDTGLSEAQWFALLTPEQKNYVREQWANVALEEINYSLSGAIH
jgi:hypothetical protein